MNIFDKFGKGWELKLMIFLKKVSRFLKKGSKFFLNMKLLTLKFLRLNKIKGR